MPAEDRPTRSMSSPSQATGLRDWLHTNSLGGSGSIHADPDKAPDVSLPDYEILGPLGQGGMGVVLKARHVALNRVVALKMLHGGAITSEDLARFKIEAEAIARLQHPNIVQIYEVGDLGDGLPFLTLEYVSGGSLKDRLNGEPQPPDQAAALIETLARAVQYAHAQGVVHRDLKPANVLLMTHDECRMPNENPTVMPFDIRHSTFGIPKLTDFGLAKRLDDPSGQTKTGDIIGTPSYMAPEQAGLTSEGVVGNAPVGPLVDVYALGAMLYEMLTGRPPFKGVGAMETIWQVLTEEVVPPRKFQPKVPTDLETICLKCLYKNPQHRYDSALSLAEDLRRFQQHEPILARPASWQERAVKWGKRHPTRVLILALAVLVALRLGFQFWWNQSTLQSARAEAAQARHTVDRALAIAWDSLHRLAEQGDHATAAAQAAKLLAVRPGDGEQLWQAAAVYARCAQAATPQREDYLTQALTLLHQAQEKGALSPERRNQVRTQPVWADVRADARSQKLWQALP